MSKIEGIKRYSFRNINWEEYSSESENEEKERKIKEKNLISKYTNKVNNCLKKEEISKIIRSNNYDESKIEKEIKIKLKEKSNLNVNSEWMEVRKGKIKPYKSSKNVSYSNNMNSNDNNPSKNNEKKSLNNLLNIKHNNDNFEQNKNVFKTLYRPQKRKDLNNFNALGISGKINENKDYDSDNDNKNHYFNIWKKSVINSDDENDNKGNNSIEETNINSKNDERDDKDFENTDKEIERINFEDDNNKNDKKVEKEKTFFKIWLHNTSSNDQNQKQHKERDFLDQILYKEKGKLFINNLKKISKYHKNIYNNNKKKSKFNCCDFTISKENDLFFSSYYDTIYRENLIRQKSISKDSKNTQIMYIIQPLQIPSDMNVCIVQPNQNFNYPIQDCIKNNSKNTNDP